MTLQCRAAKAAPCAHERAGTESLTASTGATAAGPNPTTASTPLPAKEVQIQKVLMLILDDCNNLHEFPLTEEDNWAALKIIEDWLFAFRVATAQMSTTKRPMLSSVHAVFRGLQNSLRSSLAKLPNDCNPRLKTALLDAHRKLSYYYWMLRPAV
ncbi:hypothetical protein EXIGLDRAFT_691657 [Exidia glandulosa HHB12029]|uniref:Uncharacterized protein n=1 Tax=Exidia glandulosa HHB12029 TaxID=1314781 RepID=A0A165Z0F2_EXIGL|nr:hypothetical protein EXIGLDRAFT_691657 [Exidia glandulosa HHB12029]